MASWKLPAGTSRKQLDLTLPSGVYLYRLSNAETQTSGRLIWQ